MKKFLIAIAVVCGLGCSSLLAHEDEQPRRERNRDGECVEQRPRPRGRRGFAFNYYRPSQVFGGIGSYGVGVSARIGGGVFDIVTAPFVTAPVVGPPETYIYYPPRIRYSPPVVERIYPRRRYWCW